MRTPTLLAAALATALGAATALAEPVTYNIDPSHTYPSFEADHMGGLSLWRGKINSTSGTITLDKTAGTGTVEVEMDLRTIDFGHQGLNDHAQRPDFLDTAQFPTATYRGRLTDFQNGAPKRVEGTLTMHGVSQPVALTIDKFLCKPHPQRGVEVCGADVRGEFNRADFGVTIGQPLFDMGVTLRIQVEALATN